MDEILLLFQEPMHYFFTWLGAVSAHVLSKFKPEFHGTIPFLQGIYPSQSDAVYKRLDFIILPLIGSFIAFILMEPGNLKACLLTGITWTGSIIALIPKQTK